MKTAVRFAAALSGSFVLALAVAGCRSEKKDDRAPLTVEEQSQRDQSGASTTTLTGAPWVSNDSAIDRIVGARCGRETTCSNVGPDKHFVSTDACMKEVQSKAQDDLRAAECPGGVDAKQLEECLGAIHRESCSNPLDTIGRITACQKNQLCVSSEPRRAP